MDPLSLVLKLSKALDDRQKAVEEAENWASGNHPIPLPPPNTAAATDQEARTAFQVMCQLGVTNFLGTVAKVPASKLHVEGFQFGDSPTSTDKEAWAIWQRNHMDADSDLANAGALRTGQAFNLVWVDAAGKATITVEDPSQAIVLYEAGSRRRRRAGLKRWVDDDGYLCATLYLPGWIYKYRSTNATNTGSGLVLPAGSSDWVPRLVDGEAWPLPNPFGEVNLIEVRAATKLKPSLFGGAPPVFADQINEQRKINHTVFSLLTTMEHQSFRQRWATGWDPPTDENGTPDKAAMLKMGAARFLAFTGTGEEGGTAEPVRVGEFAQAELLPILQVIEHWVKVIASTSGTPPYAFLLGNMINVAADSLARIEGTHIAMVGSFARCLGEGHNDTLRLALKIENNPKWQDTTGGVVWGEFEQRTATEQGNLAQIFQNMGAPDEVAYATLPGVSQQEAARWVLQKRAAELLGALAEDGNPSQVDPVLLKNQADAFGALVRAGVDPDDAALRVGLPGLKLSGGVPVSLRFSETDAQNLEAK